MEQHVPLRPKEQSISAVVTRANGRVEKLGVISYSSRNPLKHVAVNLWIKLKARYRIARGR